MALLRCKMCGGDLELIPESTIAECLSCGSKLTVPTETDERIINLYNRANYFRQNNEFDKAIGVFESILNERSTEAEAHWGLVLCKYGVEYVDDPKAKRKIPTCHRTQYVSILSDPNYKEAINYADAYSRLEYEREALEIDQIQKGILAISSKEEPFDVFVCYKELDNTGQRTRDSVDAHDIYDALSRKGFKVFFSRITLEEKAGSAYEPYIFAALNSAKVMVLVTSSRDHLESPWVKNEWSRFLNFIKDDHSRVLIPAYRNMSPYDLPDELSYLQAMDMEKIGFLQDLVHGIEKIIRNKDQGSGQKEKSPAGASQPSENSLLERAYICLEHGDFSTANSLLEMVLNINPKSYQANLGKLLVNNSARTIEELENSTHPIDKTLHGSLAMQFANDDQRKALTSVNKFINDRLNKKALVEAEKEKELIQQSILSLKNKIEPIEKSITIQQKVIDDLKNVSTRFFFFDIGKKETAKHLSKFYDLGQKELGNWLLFKALVIIYLVIGIGLPIWFVIYGYLPPIAIFFTVIFIVIFGFLWGFIGKMLRKKHLNSIISPLLQETENSREELSDLMNQLRHEEEKLQGVRENIKGLKEYS